jgi:hypothetical protein
MLLPQSQIYQYLDSLSLANPMRSGYGLQIILGVPIRFTHDDIRGLGQIDP